MIISISQKEGRFAAWLDVKIRQQHNARHVPDIIVMMTFKIISMRSLMRKQLNKTQGTKTKVVTR